MTPEIKIQYFYIFFVAFGFDIYFMNVFQCFNVPSVPLYGMNMKFYLTKIDF